MIHEFVCYYSKVMFAAITKYFQWLGSMGPGMKIRFFLISKCSLKIVVIFEILQGVNWEAISKLVKCDVYFRFEWPLLSQVVLRNYESGIMANCASGDSILNVIELHNIHICTLMTLYECIIPQHFRIARLWYFIYLFQRNEKLLIF